MKKCPRCGSFQPESAMVCRCGNSFVKDPAAARRPPLTTGIGCFVWLFLANFLLNVLAAALLLNRPPNMPAPEHPLFGWYFAFSGLPSLWAAIALFFRKKHGYTLGMVLCGVNILSIPFGTILAILLMNCLARERHHFDR